MWSTGFSFVFLLALCQTSDIDDITDPETQRSEIETSYSEVETTTRKQRVTRARPPGIAEYRSALTLDWMVAEDHRQRNLADTYRTKPAVPSGGLNSNCVNYPKPASGKVARLLLELLKNLEGDNATLTIDLVQNLIHANLLMESMYFEAEPDLDSILKIPESMLGEPHATFPRILAMLWLMVTDPATINSRGWCAIKTTSKFIAKNRPKDIAKQMKILDPVVARARYVIEEFTHHVTPINLITSKEPPPFIASDMRRQAVTVNAAHRGINIPNNPVVTQAVHKVPLLDGDGNIHEEVNVVEDFEPHGRIPNVVLTVQNAAGRLTHEGVKLILTILTLFIL